MSPSECEQANDFSRAARDLIQRLKKEYSFPDAHYNGDRYAIQHDQKRITVHELAWENWSYFLVEDTLRQCSVTVDLKYGKLTLYVNRSGENVPRGRGAHFFDLCLEARLIHGVHGTEDNLRTAGAVQVPLDQFSGVTRSLIDRYMGDRMLPKPEEVHCYEVAA